MDEYQTNASTELMQEFLDRIKANYQIDQISITAGLEHPLVGEMNGWTISAYWNDPDGTRTLKTYVEAELSDRELEWMCFMFRDSKCRSQLVRGLRP